MQKNAQTSRLNAIRSVRKRKRKKAIRLDQRPVSPEFDRLHAFQPASALLLLRLVLRASAINPLTSQRQSGYIKEGELLGFNLHSTNPLQTLPFSPSSSTATTFHKCFDSLSLSVLLHVERNASLPFQHSVRSCKPSSLFRSFSPNNQQCRL